MKLKKMAAEKMMNEKELLKRNVENL